MAQAVWGRIANWCGVAGHLWAVILQGSAPARRVRALITGRGPDLQGGPASFVSNSADFVSSPAGFVSSHQNIPGSGGRRAGSRVGKAGSEGLRASRQPVFHVFRGEGWVRRRGTEAVGGHPGGMPEGSRGVEERRATIPPVDVPWLQHPGGMPDGAWRTRILAPFQGATPCRA